MFKVDTTIQYTKITNKRRDTYTESTSTFRRHHYFGGLYPDGLNLPIYPLIIVYYSGFLSCPVYNFDMKYKGVELLEMVSLNQNLNHLRLIVPTIRHQFTRKIYSIIKNLLTEPNLKLYKIDVL